MKRSILMLEHDDDDRYITQTVFDERQYPVSLQFVNNSDELIAYLLTCERHLNTFPSVILLTQHAAPLTAVEIVKYLKGSRRYSHIPVVILSGTADQEFVQQCYEAGANSFILKPSTSKEINQKISTFVTYWFETVELPKP